MGLFSNVIICVYVGFLVVLSVCFAISFYNAENSSCDVIGIFIFVDGPTTNFFNSDGSFTVGIGTQKYILQGNFDFDPSLIGRVVVLHIEKNHNSVLLYMEDA